MQPNFAADEVEAAATPSRFVPEPFAKKKRRRPQRRRNFQTRTESAGAQPQFVRLTRSPPASSSESRFAARRREILAARLRCVSAP